MIRCLLTSPNIGFYRQSALLSWFILEFVGSVATAQIKFRKFSTAQGLSQSSVLALHQDRQGFLWLGTADGLNRYDGYNFTVFRHQQHDPFSLSSNEITALSEDSKGRLWIGTVAGGINYYDPGSGHFYEIPLWAGNRRSMLISSVAASGPDVWVGTYDAGLFHINVRTLGVRWLCKPHNLIPETNTTALAIGANGSCWVGVGTGLLYQVRGNRVLQRLKLPLPAGDQKITTLYEDHLHRLWIGTAQTGAYRLDPGAYRCHPVLQVPRQLGGLNEVTTFWEDRRHTLWIGTDDGTLAAPEGDLLHALHYRAGPESDTGLSSHAVKSITEDRDGNVWIGTWEGGLNVAYEQPERFRVLTFRPNDPHGLLARKVTAVGGDLKGGIWLGSANGLTYWQPASNTFSHWLPPRIPGPDINLIYNQPAATPFIGVWNKLFCTLNPVTNRFQQKLVTLSRRDSVANSVRAFAPARNGAVWIWGQQVGLIWFQPRTGQYRQFSRSADGFDLLGFEPTSLCETIDSTLWFGTFNSGLLAYDLHTGRTRSYNHTPQAGSLSENHVLSLLEDSRRQLWVGTNGGGLNRFNPKTGQFTVHTTANGLSNNTIKSLQEDHRGNLWIATNDGLSRLSADRRQFTRYSIHDGLPGREFMVQASYRSPNNYLYFGSMDGLTYFHPDSLIANQEPIPIYLSGLRLFNRPMRQRQAGSPLQQPLAYTKTLTLHASQSVFTIDYLGLRFQHAANLQYAYRLDGFDQDWNYVGSQRSATYTNLDPGRYVFRVKVANGSGPWNEMAASLSVVILPPWYRTNWAYFAYAFAFIGALWVFRRVIKIRESFRTDLRIQRMESEKIRELDRLKTNFFTNISHEFRTPLTLIISPLEQLLTDVTAPNRQQHSLMYRNARRLLRLINQLLDLSKLEAGHLQPRLYQNTLPDFVERLVNSFDLSLQQHQLTLKMDLDFPNTPVWYDPDMLEKVLVNLVSNALKYTPDGGQVTVSLRLMPTGFAELEVADTGIGIEAEKVQYIFDRFYQVDGEVQQKNVGTGIGLALTKELIELVGGTITVRSEVGKGSAFTVVFPVEERFFEAAVLQYEVTYKASPTAFVMGEELPPTNLAQVAHRQHLLLVEDNDDLRAYICSLFVDRFTVYEAADGQAGWEMAQTLAPDFIISDLVMPRLNGIALCQLVKATPQTSHIPFILLTSRQNTDSQVAGLTAGADDYVVKPFNAQLLESRVNNLLRSREQLRERFSRVITVNPSEVTTTSADEQFLTRILALIEARIDDPSLSLKDLEDALNLSESLLYRKLKNLTGLSGNEFIRSIRLKRAAQWLQTERDITISEVAYRVGFRDPAYFTRCFSKQFGQSPRQFMQHAANVTL